MKIRYRSRSPRAMRNSFNTCSGFTLIEVAMAILVFSVVMGGMYSFLTQAGKASSKSNSRQDLVTQSNIMMKQLQDDFRVTQLATVTLNPDQGTIQLMSKINSKDAKVTYTWKKPTLVRKSEYEGKVTVHQFTDSMEAFSVEKKPRPSTDEAGSLNAADEQMVIRMELSSWVPGTSKPITHEQHAMATMRQASSLKYDPHWRNVGDMKGAFSAYGNLLDSLTQDSQLLVEDVAKTTESLVKDAENTANDALNNNLTNLKQAKDQVAGALKDLKKGKLDLDTSLDDMTNNLKSLPTDIFKREAKKPGTWLGSKSDALKRVQDAFVNMKTVEDCKIEKLRDAAKPFKLNDAFDSFLKSKKEALQNKVKMNNQEASLTAILNRVDAKISSGGTGGSE